MNTRKKGSIAENKAIEFLIKNGFKIVKTNFYCKFAEIDIIALKNNTLHFIEVKSGKNFEPIYNITPKKVSKIVRCAYFYIQKYNLLYNFEIDAIIIKDKKLEFIKNITL